MRLYAIEIIYKTPAHSTNQAKLLYAARDLSSFGYFQQGSVKEFMDFTAKIVVERTQACTRSSVKEQEYLCHTFVREDNLAGVIISDQEYDKRVAQTLLNKVLEDFTALYAKPQWDNIAPGGATCKKIDEYLTKYQDPRSADPLMRVQNDLDETKIILHDTLEALLQRGEKLDDLVERSEGLSAQSKMFYTTARKTNRCCTIL